MGGVRGDEDAVTGAHRLRLGPDGHETAPFEDEIHLLGRMTVNPLLATRLDLDQRRGQVVGLGGPG